MQKERVLSVGERIMYVSDKQTINCLFPVRIIGTVSLQNIENTLLKIQQKHPLLRSTIQAREKGPTFVFEHSAPAIPIIVYERLNDTHWETISKIYWHKHIDVSKGPLAQLIWLKGEAIAEFILVCPHCIADGVSVTTLLREFLLLLDNAAQPIGNPQAFIETVDYPQSVSPLKRMGMAFKGVLGKGFAELMLPRKRNQQKVIDINKAYMLHYRLDKQTSKQLLESCKQHGVSLYAFMGILFLEEFKVVFPAKAKGRLICPVDIRKFLNTIKADQLFAFAPIIELQLRKNKVNVWEEARLLKKQITDGLSKMDITAVIYMNNRFLSIVPKLLNHLFTTAGSHDFTFSNMGNLAIPQQFDAFQVEAVFSPSVIFPWRNPNTMVMSSYNGVLDFTFMSNEEIVPKSDAERFINQSFSQLIFAINRHESTPNIEN